MFFLVNKKYIYIYFSLYLRNLTLQDMNVRYVQRYLEASNERARVKQTECWGPAPQLSIKAGPNT